MSQRLFISSTANLEEEHQQRTKETSGLTYPPICYIETYTTCWNKSIYISLILSKIMNKHHDVSIRRQIECCATARSANNTENIKALHVCPLWGKVIDYPVMPLLNKQTTSGCSTLRFLSEMNNFHPWYWFDDIFALCVCVFVTMVVWTI